jgi:DNA-binding MarR family transcriptional regulator
MAAERLMPFISQSRSSLLTNGLDSYVDINLTVLMTSNGPTADPDLNRPDPDPLSLGPLIFGSCLCLHLQRAARSMARRYDEALRPLDLSNGQFSLLMLLTRRERHPIGRLAADLGMDRTSVTALLKPLARRGLVHLSADAADRRSRLPALTETGRDLLRQAVPLWQQVQLQAQALAQTQAARIPISLSAADLRTTLRLLSA